MKNFLDEFALQNNKTSKEVYKSDYEHLKIRNY